MFEYNLSLGEHAFQWQSTPLRLAESDSVIRVCHEKGRSELTIQWIGVVGSSQVATAILFALAQGWDPRDRVGFEIGADANFEPIELVSKPKDADADWFFNDKHGLPQQKRDLRFHQATFDRLGLEPLESADAMRILANREAQLGFPLPESVREFYSLRDAPRILAGACDIITPITQLGHDYSPEFRLAEIFHDWYGPPQLYLHLNGDPDPVVRLIEDALDDEFDEDGLPKMIVGTFSQVTLQQANYLLAMWERELEREQGTKDESTTRIGRLLEVLKNAFRR